MANVYVTSAETYSGKSALCIGLGIRFRADGLKTGYMKPVNINCQLREGRAFDEDVAFAKQTFEMTEPPEVICPVALTPAKFAQQLNGPETDFAPKLQEGFEKVSAGRDVVILEGARSWREGYVVGLPAKRVVDLLDSRVLAVLRYDETLLVDRSLAAEDYFKKKLAGVVINETPATQMEHVHTTIVPFLSRHGVQVLGVLPQENSLAAPTVAELAEGLHAEILTGAEHSNELVEHMLVGAMSGEAALKYFRQVPNKAVITGGDRADIQLSALETSTRCLILSGNLYPSPVVLNRADELGVPILLTDTDTLSATEIVSGYIGRSRFQQPQKVALFTALLNEHFNFAALYEQLGIKPK